jgi:2-hydroxy-6-oxonona-2,4-dienedioate hydrolase
MKDYPAIYKSKSGYEAIMALYDSALAQAPVQYETITVKTRYGHTHVLIGGPLTGQPIFAFHGWNGNAAGVGSEFPFLFDLFRVYMPDIIGHPGRSSANRPRITGSTYADWAADVLDALNIQQTIMLGISGGGWVTMKVAAYYPQKVSRAIVISTDGLSSANTLGMLWGMLPVALFPNRITAAWFLKFMTAPHTPKGEYAQGFAETMRILIKHYKTQGNPGQMTDNELRQINIPLLALMGEYERLFEPQIAVERARSLIPGLVSAEIVPNAGHLMPADQPDWLKHRVLKFIQAGI